MPILVLLPIITAVISLLKTGLLSYIEVKGVLDKYQNTPATPESIEQLRLELLAAAHIPDAVDDPRIREQLIADGIDPESLRIA